MDDALFLFDMLCIMLIRGLPCISTLANKDLAFSSEMMMLSPQMNHFGCSCIPMHTFGRMRGESSPTMNR